MVSLYSRPSGTAHGNLGDVVTNASALASCMDAATAVTLEGDWIPGDFWNMRVRGTYLNNSGTTVTPQFQPVIGGVAVTAYTPNAARATSAFVQPFFFDLEAMVQTVGASGLVAVHCRAALSGPQGSATPAWVGTGGEPLRQFSNVLTVDTTGNIALDFKVLTGAAGSGSTNFTPTEILVRMGHSSTRIT